MVQDDLLVEVRRGRKVFLDVRWLNISRMCMHDGTKPADWADENGPNCVYLFEWENILGNSSVQEGEVASMYVYRPTREDWSELCDVCRHIYRPAGGFQADFSSNGVHGTTTLFETLSELTIALSQVELVHDALFKDLSELSLGMK